MNTIFLVIINRNKDMFCMRKMFYHEENIVFNEGLQLLEGPLAVTRWVA